jgi:predicted nucleic acid-binding protein
LIAFADSSFLVSLYVTDSSSRRAELLVKKLPRPVLFSSIGELEFTNALSQRVFRGEMSLSQAHAVRELFLNDVAEGLYLLKAITPSMYARAKQIALTRTPELGCRSLDILQVVSALESQSDIFCTFDRIQSKLAKAEGLRVIG